MKKEETSKKSNGFVKVLLGIAIAWAWSKAYEKVPAVKNISNTVCNGVKNGAKKLGEKVSELGAKNNTEAAPATKPAN